jgi:hypothetical protein
MSESIIYYISIQIMENNGIHMITFEDDVSRKILLIGEFNNSTTDNSLEKLWRSMV